MSAPAPAAAAPASGGRQALATVRRVVVFVLLAVLVPTAATGLSGLLGRVLSAGQVRFGQDTAALAGDLASTLVAGPLAALLLWAVWRAAADPAERASVAWALYVSSALTVALVVATASALSAAAAAATGSTPGGGYQLGTAAVWAGIWWLHRRLWHHPARGPVRLGGVPATLGWAYGLALVLVNGTGALAGLLDRAVGVLAGDAALGPPWWGAPVAALVWAAGGAAVWWWHAASRGGRRERSGLEDTAVVVAGTLAPAVLAVGGAITVLYAVLDGAAGALGTPDGGEWELLGTGLAMLLVGALVWSLHLGAGALPDTRGAAARLVVAGVGLAAAASGLGVLVNAGLAAATPQLAGGGEGELGLGGLAALLVGAAVWWPAWRSPEPGDARPRRVYLVVVFGVSAAVALATLLVIGARAFEYALGGGAGAGLLERTRAPLGLLLAAGAAAAYHFAVWKADPARRPAPPETGPVPVRRVVVVATERVAGPALGALRAATGARIEWWPAAGAADGAEGDAPEADAGWETWGDPPDRGPEAGRGAHAEGRSRGGTPRGGPDADTLVAAALATGAPDVLLVLGPGAAVRAVPLAAPRPAPWTGPSAGGD